MSKEWLLMTIITLHHLFVSHCMNLSVIVLDLGIWSKTITSDFTQHCTQKKIVRSYYCLITVKQESFWVSNSAFVREPIIGIVRFLKICTVCCKTCYRMNNFCCQAILMNAKALYRDLKREKLATGGSTNQ